MPKGRVRVPSCSNCTVETVTTLAGTFLAGYNGSEAEWPGEAERVSLIHLHFGARQKAYSWALAQVKADGDAKSEDPNHISCRLGYFVHYTRVEIGLRTMLVGR